MLSVYYDKICIKFASHHLLLYVVYITELYVGTEFSGLHVPKIIEFIHAFKCYQQNVSGFTLAGPPCTSSNLTLVCYLNYIRTH